jgi:hypothetical protein
MQDFGSGDTSSNLVGGIQTCGLEPLTVDTPLTQDEVSRNPIFYELELNPDRGDENLIIDVIYDNLSPLRMQDL